MNERMFELIQQQNNNRGLLWTEEDKEKFAKLIVEECVGYLEGEIKRLNQYARELSVTEEQKLNDVDTAIEKCYDNIVGIKEHFGVEP